MDHPSLVAEVGTVLSRAGFQTAVPAAPGGLELSDEHGAVVVTWHTQDEATSGPDRVQPPPLTRGEVVALALVRLLSQAGFACELRSGSMLIVHGRPAPAS